MDVLYKIDNLDNEYTFMLFGNCILTKGYVTNIICDLHLSKFIEVPKGLEELCQTKNLKEISSSTESKFYQPIIDFYNRLAKLQFGFFTTIPELFPTISLEHDDPETVSNAVLRYDAHSPLQLAPIFEKLSDTLCRHIVIDMRNISTLDELNIVLLDIRKANFKSVDLYIRYHPFFDSVEFITAVAKTIRVISITIYNANEEKNIPSKNDLIINYIKSSDNIFDHCGAIGPEFFDTRRTHFLESQQKNTCLNKKLTIDTNGAIKSCPVMPQTFGNIEEADLFQVIQDRNLQNLWSIKKDEIESCKDCEFRHICTDCRGHILDPENLYSKPAKCTYDPYKGAWEDE